MKSRSSGRDFSYRRAKGRNTTGMVWYGWIAYAFLWLVVIAVFPIRVEVYVGFSLFDAKMGVRVGVFGAKILRVWLSLEDKEVLLNGRPYHAKRPQRGRSRRMRAVKKAHLAVSLLARADARFALDCMVGFANEERNWALAALADALSLPKTTIAVYLSREQVCKGMCKGRIIFTLWDLLAALAT